MDRKKKTPKKILLVNWVKEHREEIEAFLREKGFEVIATGDYLEIKSLLNKKPNLILIEPNAQWPDGLEEETEYGRITGLVILKHIKQNQSDLQLPPVIVLSVVQKRLIDDLEVSKNVGVVDVLEIPIPANKLLTSINKALKQNRRKF